MKNRTITLLCFGLLVLLQLWTPAAMIFNREGVLKSGTAYKFRAAPVDPSDPFRGKYIILSFAENSFANKQKTSWQTGEAVYVQLTRDERGFAKIESLHKERPSQDADFVKAQISYVVQDSAASVIVEWPFTRFYMEESKAAAAEQQYARSLADTNNITYALVKVKNGDAVLENVFINDQPIVTYLK